MSTRLDVHHHVIPPVYADAIDRALGGTQLKGVDPIYWDLDTDLEVMDRNGIQMALLTVTAPGVTFLQGQEAANLARAVNEFMAQLMADHPSRYGGLAVLPLPDVDAAIAEADYALDVLGLDGVGIYSNFAGTYLGDPKLEKFFAYLEERGAVAHLHPAIPASTDQQTFGLPPSLYEFTFDTTRAVTNLLYSGTLDRHPDLKIVVSHAGGTLPYLAKRLTYASTIASQWKANEPKDLLDSLSRLYYDTAMSSNPVTLSALTKFVDTSQILFGSDFPYMPESTTAETVQAVEEFFSPEDLALIDYENYRGLFPAAVARITESAPIAESA